MYWDGVDGSLDRNDAVTFDPAGITGLNLVGAGVETIHRLGDWVRDGDGDIVYPAELDRTNLQTPASVDVDGDIPAQWFRDPPTPTVEDPAIVMSYRSRPTGDVDVVVWSAWSTPQSITGPPGSDSAIGLGDTPPTPITNSPALGLNADNFFVFIVGITLDPAIASQYSLNQTRLQISTDESAAHTAAGGFTDASMILVDKILPGAPALWTFLAREFKPYYASAQVRNARDGSLSLWSAPELMVPLQYSPDIGFASKPPIELRRSAPNSGIVTLVITRPLNNHETVYGYNIQAIGAAGAAGLMFPSPSDPGYTDHRLRLRDVHATAKGIGHIVLETNRFVVSGVQLVPNSLVGKLLYIHKGITADGEVTFPHADTIIANDATTIRVSPSQHYRVPYGEANPFSEAARQFNFVVADGWLREPDDLLVSRSIIVFTPTTIEVPPETHVQLIFPTDHTVRVRVEAGNLVGLSQYSDVALFACTVASAFAGSGIIPPGSWASIVLRRTTSITTGTII